MSGNEKALNDAIDAIDAIDAFNRARAKLGKAGDAREARWWRQLVKDTDAMARLAERVAEELEKAPQ